MTLENFEVFYRNDGALVTLLRGARLDAAVARARQVARQQRCTAYVRSQKTGAVTEILPTH
jgi:hypothetical protein